MCYDFVININIVGLEIYVLCFFLFFVMRIVNRVLVKVLVVDLIYVKVFFVIGVFLFRFVIL